jgi:GNAT superfamily N-acetyltransferase
VLEVVAAASPDDVRAIARRRHPDDAGVRLCLESAERGNVWLARDDGEAIGIAVARDYDGERYVGDCFVEPSYRGQGIGTKLLAAAFDGGDDVSRTVLLEQGDAAGSALAYRCGMAPRELLLRFAGAVPREEELARMAAGDYRFAVEPISPSAHAIALNELDRQTRGVARLGEHAEFARSAVGHAFFLNGECVAYAYVWGDGRIGPFACTSEAYLVQILAYALVTLQRDTGASWCTLLVPAENRRIARCALRAGLRIGEILTLASDSSIGQRACYVGYHRLLL